MFFSSYLPTPRCAHTRRCSQPRTAAARCWCRWRSSRPRPNRVSPSLARSGPCGAGTRAPAALNSGGHRLPTLSRLGFQVKVGAIAGQEQPGKGGGGRRDVSENRRMLRLGRELRWARARTGLPRAITQQHGRAGFECFQRRRRRLHNLFWQPALCHLQSKVLMFAWSLLCASLRPLPLVTSAGHDWEKSGCLLLGTCPADTPKCSFRSLLPSAAPLRHSRQVSRHAQHTQPAAQPRYIRAHYYSNQKNFTLENYAGKQRWGEAEYSV